MNGDIADHLAKTPLTTLALFSVTNTKTGKINTSQTGYKRITGAIGKQLIREAHDRGVAVQLVYTSFGTARNERFFGSLEVQDTTIAGLVALADRTGVDGINVDVELLDADLVPAYGAFVGRLREALRGERSPMASSRWRRRPGRPARRWRRAASASGADRIFLMGYDYHYAGSDVGASAPMDRRDGAEQDLVWSLDLYEAVGVPVDKTILGLPLYGMRWRVAGPELGAPRLGDGAIWVPADNPQLPRRSTGPTRARPDRDRRVLRRRPDRQPRARRLAGDRRVAGDLRRFAADPRAEAGPRRRPRPGRRRVLGDRLRAGHARLHRTDDALRGGRDTVTTAREPAAIRSGGVPHGAVVLENGSQLIVIGSSAGGIEALSRLVAEPARGPPGRRRPRPAPRPAAVQPPGRDPRAPRDAADQGRRRDDRDSMTA